MRFAFLSEIHFYLSLHRRRQLNQLYIFLTLPRFASPLPIPVPKVMAKHTPFFGQTAQAKHRASLSTLNLAIRLLSSFAKSKFLKYFIFGLRTIFVPEII